uniref:Uncharacterized protein n=1 Tax=Meloidogyne enterolobii TaxID=390850 RepID=A0A6V7XQY9_MELEN|nr:unnamed protein product [Meloidogyne enterolobii]
MEVRDREYGKEIKKRGRIRPGTFEGWKKRNNIITAFTVIDGTATAIEFDRTRDGEGWSLRKLRRQRLIRTLRGWRLMRTLWR